MKKLVLCVTGLILTLALLTACNSSSNGTAQSEGDGVEQKYLTIATGGSSGALYALGGTLSKIYNEKLGYQASAQSTGASVENINLLATKKVDLALAASDAVAFANEGIENFQETGAIDGMKAISGFNYNILHIIVLKDGPISSIKDLKGKRIGVGAPNSATEIMSRRILEAHGLSYDDVQPDYLSFAEAAEQLKNNAIDAAVILSGLPKLSSYGFNSIKGY